MVVFEAMAGRWLSVVNGRFGRRNYVLSRAEGRLMVEGSWARMV